jgi:ABC-type transporter Mla MlaB component
MFVLPATINHQNALKIRQDGLSALAKNTDEQVVSGSELTQFDSTALSVLMAFVRAYPDLKIIEAPKKLVSLSKVYGLETLLPISSSNE